MLRHKILSMTLLSTLVMAGCSDSDNAVQHSGNNGDRSSISTSKVAETLASNANELSVSILDISEREFGDLNAISLLFNTPIKPDQPFKKYIKVEPQLGEPILSEDGKSLYFTGIEPATQYQLDLGPGLEADNGSVIETGVSTEIKTRSLPSLVSFESDGLVMVPGKVDSLPLIAVNVPEADINIYKVKPDKIVNFFAEYASLNDSDRWYYDETQLGQTVDSVYSSRLKISTLRNQRNRVSFPISHVMGIEEGGIYLATVRAPGGFDFQATWFTVSAVGIQARDYGESTRFITQDAKSGGLLAGVELSILDYNNKVIASGESDSNGAWETDNAWQRKSPRLVVGTKGNQVTVLNYHAPNFDLSDFSVSGRKTKVEEYFTYSPRDIYRPGEELIISTLTRGMDGELISNPLMIELIKPDGESAGKWRIDASTTGYYEFRHMLGGSAPLGKWQAQVFNPAKPKLKERFSFKVEEFLPERLRLDLEQNTLTSFSLGEPITYPIKGEYLYGAPAAGNKLDTQVSVRGWAQPFETLKGFHFGHSDNVPWQQFNLDSLELDSEGKTVTKLDKKQFDWSGFDSPAELKLRYSLYESGGRAINRHKSVLLWPRNSFVGVKPKFENDVSDSEQQIAFEIVRVDKQGKLLTQGEAKATLYRLEEKYFWSHTPERGWHYQIEKNEYPVAHEVLSFTSGEPQALSLPVEWGRYRLELDDYLGKSQTVYTFQAGDNWYNAWNSASDRIKPDEVTVALDKESYRAGDIVNVKLASPTEGTAIVLLETDKVLQTVEVKLTDRKADVEIKIPQGLARHDAYISAFVVAPTEQQDKVSKRSFGIAHLPLKRSDRRLDVDINVADKLLPETSANVTVSVKDPSGNPVSGDVYVTLSAVDSGVLSVTGYEPLDPFEFFYGRRRYQAAITDMYDDLAEPTLSDQAEIRWGGDGELARGGEAPPTDVQIVSLFSSLVKVERGQANIKLDLPAFDGELTLHAVAHSDQKFGDASEITKVASPVVAQLSMPRFLALGDKANLALDLSNVSGIEQSIKLTLSTDSAVAPTNKDYQLQLADGEKQVVHFLVSADQLGAGEINAEIKLSDSSGKSISLKREWTLGVRSAYPAVYDQKTAVLQKGDVTQFPFSELSGLSMDTVLAQLRVGTTPDLGAKRHFTQLMNYPYGCLEQTTSKSQPLSVLLKHEATPEFAQAVSDVKIQQQMGAALSRYAELQKANGSFGLWDKFSPEEHWLTAYATDFLLQMKQAGVSVPESLLSQSKRRLNAYIHKRTAHSVKTWSDIPSHYEISYKAFAAYVLAKEGQVTLGPLRELVETQLDDARGMLPGVHLGLAIIETGSVEEGEKIIQTALNQKRAEGYLGDYGSVIRDQAMAIHTVLGFKAASKALKKKAMQLIPELLVDMKQAKWLSTQERAALLHLSSELYRIDSAGKWEGDLKTGELVELISASGELGQNLAISTLADTSLKNIGDKPVFASYSWTGLTENMPEAVDEGIRIRVEQFMVKNSEAFGLQKGQVLNMGDTVLTRVRFYSEKRVPDGLLINLMPAGLELENQNLQNALKLESIMLEGEPLQQRVRLTYQAFKDDRYVAAIDIPAKREQILYFLSRAVTPGEYKVPPAMAESMYKPAYRGISNSINLISVMP